MLTPVVLVVAVILALVNLELALKSSRLLHQNKAQLAETQALASELASSIEANRGSKISSQVIASLERQVRHLEAELAKVRRGSREDIDDVKASAPDDPRAPEPGSTKRWRKAAKHYDPLSGPPHTAERGDVAWVLLSSSLKAGDEGEIYLGGDASESEIKAFEDAFRRLAQVSGLDIAWGQARRGSWWRQFLVRVAARFGDADLDTTKRAGEAWLLDQKQAPAAKGYSEAISALMTASAPITHVYVVTKNVVFLKTMRDGESVVLSRTLTSAEVPFYESGKLHHIMANPDSAFAFITRGVLIASAGEEHSGEAAASSGQVSLTEVPKPSTAIGPVANPS